MDDPEMGKVQSLQGLVHRFGYFRGFAEFALKIRNVNPNFQWTCLNLEAGPKEEW